MAQIINNPHGFKVIEVSRAEMVEKLSEYGCVGICDYCAKSPVNGYYIAVLNQWYCPECYKRWVKDARYYPEDARVEDRNFNYYKTLFGLSL